MTMILPNVVATLVWSTRRTRRHSCWRLLRAFLTSPLCVVLLFLRGDTATCLKYNRGGSGSFAEKIGGGGSLQSELPGDSFETLNQAVPAIGEVSGDGSAVPLKHASTAASPRFDLTSTDSLSTAQSPFSRNELSTHFIPPLPVGGHDVSRGRSFGGVTATPTNGSLSGNHHKYATRHVSPPRGASQSEGGLGEEGSASAKKQAVVNVTQQSPRAIPPTSLATSGATLRTARPHEVTWGVTRGDAGTALSSSSPHSSPEADSTTDDEAFYKDWSLTDVLHSTPFKLERLPWHPKSLSPSLSEETIQYHYGRHHAAYVRKLNEFALKDETLCRKSLSDVVRSSTGGVFNNAAQIWNHAFFWKSLSPEGGGKPFGPIESRINKRFGSFKQFQDAFTSAATGLFGSGWVWLVEEQNGDVSIVASQNASNPLRDDPTKKPLLCIDVWEHAYYIDYRNSRPRYIDNWFQIVNWDFANRNLAIPSAEMM